MKKCPKCGNPSYDGAPVCGNCGYNFPKPKSTVPKGEDIFQKEPKVVKISDDEDTISIIKEKKYIIATILIITIIVILGIFVMGYNNSTINDNDFIKYNADNFSFKYPNTWKAINGTDIDHIDAIFYQNENNVTIEFYNVTSELSSKEVVQDIINYAQLSGSYVEFVDSTTLNNINQSNIILQDLDGNYTRYVSIYNEEELYVFKIAGQSRNLVESEDINATLDTVVIA